MNPRPEAHLGLGGPLDLLIELGLPLLIFIALWWWSSRGERRGRHDADLRRALRDPEFYRSLSTSDLRWLAGQLEERRDPDAAATGLLADVRAELGRREAG